MVNRFATLVLGGGRTVMLGRVLAGVLTVVLALVAAIDVWAMSPAAAKLLAELEADAELQFSAERGRATWYQEVEGKSCTSCHTDSLESPGRHHKTGKVIEPMAPSVNPKRLSKVRKINKWFLRNCKWTFGRECTAQEKGDILLWLSAQ